MPVYEYECQSCGAQISEYMPIAKMKKSTSCPKCGKLARKVMSKLGFVDGGYTPKFYK